MSIHIIVAISENNVIGKNGELPWHIPEDLQRFKRLTMNHVVLMGHKTWASIPQKYRPLPGRKNVVLSREESYVVPTGVQHFSSLESALNAHEDETVFIIGGGEIYRQTIALADKMYVTRIHKEIEGTVFFPVIDSTKWKEIEREDHDVYSFVTLERLSDQIHLPFSS